MIPHDSNFKNLFYDFPKETLQWLLPQAEQNWGEIVSIDFTRQEPKKHHLSDAGLVLDLPILFHFESSYGWWSFRRINPNFPYTSCSGTQQT